MQFTRHDIQACCGKKATVFKLGEPITQKLISSLISIGYKEYQHFTKSGLLYVDNLEFILTGPIGSNELQVKCKKGNCDQKLNEFEVLLTNLE